ncbi:recombination endonuclease subunit [Aeromonas phage Ah1]|uniref:Recombination endonuclease subunit n=1 Tax=Aeromonas phage Ah1 TaxID=2053701 RepID=A0A2H4YEG1_9CAUD|nr:recombination endonuclease subunit [Aeromonas phage Ah1]AUE22568.1 recombination endonuclease subunit [Aeromonas phage Ah1]
MKLIIEGDKHVGTQKDSAYMQNAIYLGSKFLCDYAKKHDIKTLIQTGDWFDVRAGLSQETMKFQREVLSPMYQDAFTDEYIIIGNHDMHLKDKIMPNSVTEMFHDVPGIHIIDKPTTVAFGDTLWDLYPWKCSENKEAIEKYAAETDSEYCVGHWELDGFEFYKGIPSTGEAIDFLSNYKQVISGHYHTSSRKGNVLYTGTPYTLTMGDCNEIRGFWVFDTDTKELEFVANPDIWHLRIDYKKDFDPKVIDKCKDKIVELVIYEFDDKLDAVMAQFENVCYEFRHKQVYSFSSDVEDITETKKVIEQMKDYVTGLAIDDDDKKSVGGYVQELYAVANSGKGA